MLRRSLTIFACICMLGMTVLQASAVPCCCKTGSEDACAKHTASNHVKEAKKACSHMGHSGAKPSMASQTGPQKTVATFSHACRCLHLSPIVALSSQEVWDSSIRATTAALVAHSPVSYSRLVHAIETLPDSGSPSIAIHIATCNLRC